MVLRLGAYLFLERCNLISKMSLLTWAFISTPKNDIPTNNIIMILERSFLFISQYQINDHKSHDNISTISSSTYSNEPYYHKTLYDDEESITMPHSSSLTNKPMISRFSIRVSTHSNLIQLAFVLIYKAFPSCDCISC